MLSMPRTRVKTSTIGRPLAIKLSVRRAKGKGKRNLYGPQCRNSNKHVSYLRAVEGAL